MVESTDLRSTRSESAALSLAIGSGGVFTDAAGAGAPWQARSGTVRAVRNALRGMGAIK
jgi:hypothetical protein